ncbi:uncharacterized protein [Heliangelus exortis]|uniref:uncharacterized protein isoform X2 n=1 Tax=Heliangelus exortis TaxID=472823 RepID=UPI003A90DE05
MGLHSRAEHTGAEINLNGFAGGHLSEHQISAGTLRNQVTKKPLLLLSFPPKHESHNKFCRPDPQLMQTTEVPSLPVQMSLFTSAEDELQTHVRFREQGLYQGHSEQTRQTPPLNRTVTPRRHEPNRTEPDRTEPDRTEPDRTASLLGPVAAWRGAAPPTVRPPALREGPGGTAARPGSAGSGQSEPDPVLSRSRHHLHGASAGQPAPRPKHRKRVLVRQVTEPQQVLRVLPVLPTLLPKQLDPAAGHKPICGSSERRQTQKSTHTHSGKGCERQDF